MKCTKQRPPTAEQYTAYQSAWDYFNRFLFDSTLQPCLLSFSRHARSKGFFKYQNWGRGQDRRTHEIALNPDLLLRPLADIMGTLVHEMVHQWQYDHGRPSRSGYHNAEWADKMDEVGLAPSHTGAPGGKRTGQAMTHYILPGGPFERAFKRMPKEYLIPWRSGTNQPDNPGRNPGNSKVKYQCPECKAAVWGKPNLDIICGDDQVQFVELDAAKVQANGALP
jgi:hypothetical protein